MSAPLPPLGHTAGATFHGGDADGDDGDDPSRPKGLPSAHEVDAPPGAGSRMNKDRRDRRRLEGALNISEPCPVCPKRFRSSKALHGHMRMHPERYWRGVLPPAQRQRKNRSQEEEAALSLIILSEGPNAGPRPEFQCMCGRKFDSRQALDGRRASHRSVKGRYATGRGQSKNERAKGEGSKKGDTKKYKGKKKLEEEPATEKEEDKADASQAQTSKKGKKVVIDLNMPTPQDDESSPEIDLNRKLEK